jgi:Domain of unknown function (DUF4070)
MVEFIQKSGIPVAMVRLLQAMPGTQLFRRLRREGRILDADHGDNTDDKLSFFPPWTRRDSSTDTAWC